MVLQKEDSRFREWKVAPVDIPGLAVVPDLFRIALVAVLSIGACTFTASAQEDGGLPHEVNTFIGSKDDGNTFPGASAPFGLIQVSPIGEHYSGWRYDDPKIRGFGHSFLSGAGCWEQGGQVSVLPVTGEYRSGRRFRHRQAKAASTTSSTARATAMTARSAKPAITKSVCSITAASMPKPPR